MWRKFIETAYNSQSKDPDKRVTTLKDFVKSADYW